MGFIEVGTVTPKSQLGSPKPRIFRLEKDSAMINRLGFNNHGAEVVMNRILNNKPNGVLGINIGPNKDTEDKTKDFIFCLNQLHSQSDYITINISSPNTEGLRDFHQKDVMNKLFDELTKIKDTEALILQNHSFDKFLSKSSCHFIGDGAEKSEVLFKRENTSFTPAIYPSAKVMAQYVEQAFIAKKFEDTAYFEPYYLKDFVDGKKNKN